MIGQETLRKKIDKLITYDEYPKFSIIVGATGSGKKTLSKYIADKLHAHYILVDSKVDAIRDMIDTANKVSELSVFVIADADSMRPNAKNAVLKLVEEPPQNVYVIMTLQSINNTLDTLRSRAWVFNMHHYAHNELKQFYGSGSGFEKISSIVSTPGDVLTLKSYNIDEFIDYVKLVVDNVATVSGSNSFKIASRLQIKPVDDKKYNLKLFLSAFRCECLKRFYINPTKYLYGIQVTDKCIATLNIGTINNEMVFDRWLLDIRAGWMEDADD